MYKYILFIIFGVYFTSCSLEEVIPWESEEEIEPFLVVEGDISSETSMQEIYLTLSDNYFANEAPIGVSNASVVICGGGENYEYAESSTVSGLYLAQNSFAGQIGVDYSLSIELDEPINDAVSYKAETRVNPTMIIDTMVAVGYPNPFAGFDPNDSTVWVMMHILGLEPPDMDNYYILKFYQNGELKNDTITKYQLITDFDYEIDGHSSFTIPVYYGEYYDYDTLGIEIYSVPEEYYDYVYKCQVISQPADPFGFSGSPANVIGNINNGDGLGYFFGTSIARATSVIIPDSIYNQSPL